MERNNSFIRCPAILMEYFMVVHIRIVLKNTLIIDSIRIVLRNTLIIDFVLFLRMMFIEKKICPFIKKKIAYTTPCYLSDGILMEYFTNIL